MEIIISPGLETTIQNVRESALFNDWIKHVGLGQRDHVTVNAADVRDDQIHALQVTVMSEDDPWPTRLMLRSPTVDVLTAVTDGNERHLVFVEQYRKAIGAMVMSNVAGGINWEEDPASAARRELQEELGLDESVEFSLKPLTTHAVLASPGMLNERVHMMVAEIRVPPSQLAPFLDSLRGKKTGVKAEGEDILVHPIPAAQCRQFILSQPHPDAKTLLSLGLAYL